MSPTSLLRPEINHLPKYVMKIYPCRMVICGKLVELLLAQFWGENLNI